ncbi:MAG: hypothetical protein LV480_03620 [Methylacidiphilales bacterium]|nr:hypothetical protein [Candidatus Methylacidiphilales bacterium]
MPIDLIIACLGILAVLQGLSILLTNLETASKQIEGRSTWIAPDGTVFEEFALTELESSQVMLHDFEETRGEALLTGQLSPHLNG